MAMRLLQLLLDLKNSSFWSVNVIVCLLLTFFLLFISALYLFSSATKTKTRTQPEVSNIELLRNYHRFYDWVAEQFTHSQSLVVHIKGVLGLQHIVATVDPVNIEHILKSNFQNYIKGSRFDDNLSDLLGRGIFNADAELWSVQRKIASHEFNTKSLKAFISLTVRSEISNRLIPCLSYAADRGTTVDLQAILQKFSFDNICNLAFGVDPACLDFNEESKDLDVNMSFVQAFDEASEICFTRVLSPVPLIWKVKRILNVGSEKRLKDAVKLVDDYATEIIKLKEERLQKADSDDTTTDLLSRFMRSEIKLEFNSVDERRRFYRDIIVSFILAGRDTTSSALTWFFWLMYGHPRCERLIYEEISPVMSSAAEEDGLAVLLNYDDLKGFHYLHAALTEAMRLFPPVPLNSRSTVADDVWPDGTRVKKGWFSDYSAYPMGRMERVWGRDCREFKPERWLDNDGIYQPPDQFKYPVFHCGPRICLGKDMAYVQMKSVAAALIYNFEIVAVDGGGGTPENMLRPSYHASLVLKMKGGLNVKLRRRRKQREMLN